jgi:adenylate cyclase
MSISGGESIAQARTLYDKRLSPQSTQQMRGLLEASAAEASALAATTVLCDYLNRWNNAGRAEVNKAEAAAQQALAVNADLFLAHYAMGFVWRTRGEHEAALAAFTETLKHAPRFARAYAQRGGTLVYLGRFEDGIADVEKAIELSPRSPSRGMFYWIIGRARFFMGQYAEAVSWLQRSVRLWPNLWYNRLYLVSAYELSGNQTAARRALRAFDQAFPGYTMKSVIANERATPDKNALVIAGRRLFHDGLRRAGMPPG